MPSYGSQSLTESLRPAAFSEVNRNREYSVLWNQVKFFSLLFDSFRNVCYMTDIYELICIIFCPATAFFFLQYYFFALPHLHHPVPFPSKPVISIHNSQSYKKLLTSLQYNAEYKLQGMK